MRHKLKPKNNPRVGDIRVKSGFLLLPMTIHNEFRWLCMSKWREVYCEESNGGWANYYWKGIEWLD